MDLNLNGHVFKIESGLLDHETQSTVLIRGEGEITSGSGFLTIENNLSYYPQQLIISAVISDSSRRVGLDISSAGKPSTVTLDGSRSNTFTGDVILRRGAGELVLSKSNGATAIQGNVFVNQGTKLRFDQGNQLSRRSVVTLRGGSFSYNKSNGRMMVNSFSKLAIESDSTLDFESTGATRVSGVIYIDDLVVSAGRTLNIVNWQDGVDFFLIKKSSKNLDGVLSKVRFAGYNPNNYQLKDYSKDYWELSGVPEPATYGAMFIGAASLAVFGWRSKGGRFPVNQRKSPKWEVPSGRVFA